MLLKKKRVFFFCKGIVGYKGEKGVIDGLKFFLIKKKERMIVKIVKIYLGLSLVLLWVLWGQFIFG